MKVMRGKIAEEVREQRKAYDEIIENARRVQKEREEVGAAGGAKECKRMRKEGCTVVACMLVVAAVLGF